MIDVVLNRSEWLIVDTLAKERNENAARYEVPPGNRQPHAITNYKGVAGELALPKIMGTYPNFSQDPDQAGKPDFVMFGKECDIKTADYDGGTLNVSIETKHFWDIYVLMLINKPYMHYFGYMYKEDLIVQARIVYPGDGRSPYYRAYQKEVVFRDRFWENGKFQERIVGEQLKLYGYDE